MLLFAISDVLEDQSGSISKCASRNGPSEIDYVSIYADSTGLSQDRQPMGVMHLGPPSEEHLKLPGLGQ